MELGAFSISLSVRDLAESRAFYEALGFTETGGGDGYVILVNGGAVVGLLQDMFEGHILTFNPGLSLQGPLDDFTDIRDLRAALLAAGIEPTDDLDPDDTGPAHLVLVDPDGNRVMIDQFFPRPGPAPG